MAAKHAGKRRSIVIIGAGPAGLGAAYEIARAGKREDISVKIIDRNSTVGGLARSNEHHGYLFDVGPHRFFTKNKEVLQLWKEVLGDDFIEVPRLTRMLYKKKLFLYPVDAKDVLKKFSAYDLVASGLSYLQAKVFMRNLEPKTFEEWISKNFGKKLFNVFFKTYTEKVWGIPCDEIGAEWAAQRIKGLNFTEVVRSAFAGKKNKSKAKSLVDTFYYPRKGAGQMYEVMADIVTKAGHQIELESPVKEVRHDGKKITAVVYDKNGKDEVMPTDFMFSSMPLTHLIKVLSPKPSKEIQEAADKLYYRDHITADLVVKKDNLFPDNWIYVHAPEVKMARLANYNNFSDDMRPEKDYTGISVEYFVFKGDEVWNLSDEEIVELAKKEMDQVGLLKAEDVIDGFVVRETEAYPTYYMGHKEYYDRLKNYVNGFENLQLVGRGGMFKYNNQDHAIYTGLLAARNFLAGKRIYDVWEVNEDAEYHEEEKAEKNKA